MKTLYDLVSMIIFAGVSVLFLQRSVSPEPDETALWKYAVAAVGCAVADFLGNNGLQWPAILAFVALAIFSLIMLKPFQKN